MKKNPIRYTIPHLKVMSKKSFEYASFIASQEICEAIKQFKMQMCAKQIKKDEAFIKNFQKLGAYFYYFLYQYEKDFGLQMPWNLLNSRYRGKLNYKNVNRVSHVSNMKTASNLLDRYFYRGYLGRVSKLCIKKKDLRFSTQLVEFRKCSRKYFLEFDLSGVFILILFKEEIRNLEVLDNGW